MSINTCLQLRQIMSTMASEYECAPAYKLMHTPASLSLHTPASLSLHTPASLSLHTFKSPFPSSPSAGLLSDCMYPSPGGIFQTQPSALSNLYANSYSSGGGGGGHPPHHNSSCLYDISSSPSDTTTTPYHRFGISHNNTPHNANYQFGNMANNNNSNTNNGKLDAVSYPDTAKGNAPTSTFQSTPSPVSGMASSSKSGNPEASSCQFETPTHNNNNTNNNTNSSCVFGNTDNISKPNQHQIPNRMANGYTMTSSKTPSSNGLSGFTHFRSPKEESEETRRSRVKRFKSARRNLRHMVMGNSPDEKKNKSEEGGNNNDCLISSGTLLSPEINGGVIDSSSAKEFNYEALNQECLSSTIPQKSSCRFAKGSTLKTVDSQGDRSKRRKGSELSKQISNHDSAPPIPVGIPVLYSDDNDIGIKKKRLTTMKSSSKLKDKEFDLKLICNRCCHKGTSPSSKSVITENDATVNKLLDSKDNKITKLDSQRNEELSKSNVTKTETSLRHRLLNSILTAETNGQNQNGDRRKSDCMFSAPTSNFLDYPDKVNHSSKHQNSVRNSSEKVVNCDTNGDDKMRESKIAIDEADVLKVTVERIERTDSNSDSQLCFGCQKPVFDRYVLHVRDHGYWHAECLRCSNCHDNLSSQKSCYVKNEQVFCRNDYNILFGLSCVKCSLQFKKEQDWMRVAGEHRYHIACFLCKICKRQLGNNEKYHLVNGIDIYCTNHYRDMVSGDSSEEGQQPTKKAKRNRTSYTEAQIKFLQERFMHDSNPDGNELEKIANHINLKKRVVQVWFQNNRARLKKSANNTKGGNQENGGQSTGRVTNPSGLHDTLAMDWDNSLDPSSLEDQGYVSPSTTPSQQQQQQHHHHLHQQPPQHLRSTSSHFTDGVYGLTPLMCLTPGQGQGHPGDANHTGSSACGSSREQQLSPSPFPDIPMTFQHNNGDPMTPPSVGCRMGSNPGGDHTNGSSGDSTQGSDENNSSGNNGNGMNGTSNHNDNSHCLGMSSPIASFRSSICGDKPFGDETSYRRYDSHRERHEQQLRQMMLYHEQQQQQQHQLQQQQHYQAFGGPPVHLYGSFNLTNVGDFPSSNSDSGSNSNNLHQSMVGLCPSPSRTSEGPQNFLQLRHQQTLQQQQQQQQQIDKVQLPTYQILSPVENDALLNGNSNNGSTITTNGNGNGHSNRHHQPNPQQQQQQQQQPHRTNFDVHPSTSFSHSKTLAPPPGAMSHNNNNNNNTNNHMGLSSQSSPLPLANSAHQANTSPSHYGTKRSLTSPEELSKSEGYCDRSPVPFGARGPGMSHPYHFIPVSHAHRVGGNGFYGNDGMDTPYTHRTDGYGFGAEGPVES